MTVPKPAAPRRYRNLRSLQGVSRNALHSFYRKGLDAAGVLPDAPFPKRLPALLPQHWWPWVSSYVRHVFQPKHAFPGYGLAAGGRPGVYPLSSDPRNASGESQPIRVSLAGDWATGTIESYWVAEQMRAFAPHYTIHLGDVYYVGEPAEVDENCLGKAPEDVAGVVWPSGSIGSFALNGNHEMYANGNAYFERFLPRLGMLDPRTRRPDGQRASFFCLANEHWAVIGVDTGYNSRGFPILGQIPYLRDLPAIRPTCRLEDRLLEWFRVVVAPLLAGRGVVLLSHHQYYSGFDVGYERPARQLAPYVTGPVLWFWGHEHRLAIYGPHQAAGGFAAHGRCLGHGGMPVARGTPDARKGPTPLLWDNRVYHDYGSGEAIGFNGFANLTFAGDTLTVDYQSLARKSDGDYSGRQLLATERWRVADGRLRLVELRREDAELDGTG
jgi:calcineurin-like phosphoesterase family protein